MNTTNSIVKISTLALMLSGTPAQAFFLSDFSLSSVVPGAIKDYPAQVMAFTCVAFLGAKFDKTQPSYGLNVFSKRFWNVRGYDSRYDFAYDSAEKKSVSGTGAAILLLKKTEEGNYSVNVNGESKQVQVEN